MQLMNSFIWSKNNSFSGYLEFYVLVKFTDFKICDAIIGIAIMEITLILISFLNRKYYQNEIWSSSSVLYDRYF